MPEFMAETYIPRGGPGAPAPGDLAQAAAQASRPGAAVRFLGAILLPGEETGFWLYQAPAAEAVRAAMTAAGLRPERITPALTIRPPPCPPRPGGVPAADLPSRSATH
jgi:hypothetical protein